MALQPKKKVFMSTVNLYQANTNAQMSTSWHDYKHICRFRSPENITKNVLKYGNREDLVKMWQQKQGVCNVKSPFAMPFITCIRNARDVDPICQVFIPDKTNILILEADQPYPESSFE